MWELFLNYKKEVKENPKMIVEQKKSSTNIKVMKGADASAFVDQIAAASNPLIEIPKEKPLTMEGFECFVMDNTKITYPDLTNYFENTNDSYKDYIPICSRIRREIRHDQIDGGMTGIYNPSITQRLNSLTDKTETKQIHIEQQLFPDVSTDESDK